MCLLTSWLEVSIVRLFCSRELETILRHKYLFYLKGAQDQAIWKIKFLVFYFQFINSESKHDCKKQCHQLADNSCVRVSLERLPSAVKACHAPNKVASRHCHSYNIIVIMLLLNKFNYSIELRSSATNRHSQCGLISCRWRYCSLMLACCISQCIKWSISDA